MRKSLRWKGRKAVIQSRRSKADGLAIADMSKLLCSAKLAILRIAGEILGANASEEEMRAVLLHLTLGMNVSCHTWR
jgi:hypothetical protein